MSYLKARKTLCLAKPKKNLKPPNLYYVKISIAKLIDHFLIFLIVFNLNRKTIRRIQALVNEEILDYLPYPNLSNEPERELFGPRS
jgi:hypothetical protein